MQPVHRLQIRLIVHNKGAASTTPPSYIRVRAVVWAYGRGQTHTHTDRQTHTQTHVTTIHFESSMTHANVIKTRHLTFRVRVTTPHSMDEMEWGTQRVRRCYCRRGESSPACASVCVRFACRVRWVWRITAGLCHSFP